MLRSEWWMSGEAPNPGLRVQCGFLEEVSVVPSLCCIGGVSETYSGTSYISLWWQYMEWWGAESEKCITMVPGKKFGQL